jgi:hypothetical protein
MRAWTGENLPLFRQLKISHAQLVLINSTHGRSNHHGRKASQLSTLVVSVLVLP